MLKVLWVCFTLNDGWMCFGKFPFGLLHRDVLLLLQPFLKHYTVLRLSLYDTTAAASYNL